ncbi:5'-nucleotidase, lipoprotein e(P4) family [Ferruginibacter yonginensis]|uniref:5'-nucleotidase, lipoprotein e(P4) family n=1 Tax=Ferruginibacter yonginensis TaxID=1310416 RepID=A0ABV8QQ09_9BACT
MRFIIFISLLGLLACKTPQHLANNSNSALPQNISLNGKLFSSLFQQRAAEYRALCLQSYNMAKWRIDSYVSNNDKPKAIITDIDETILDNSPYAVHAAFGGSEYTLDSWIEWTSKSAADTMPGAAAFLKYVASKNVQVFYITNREDKERTATLKNLQKFGLPNADEMHLYTKINTSSKEARRNQVLERYDVILYMGDNLADLSVLFDKKTEAERAANVDALSAQLGKKYIVFPNANYGDWEGSLYQYNYKYTQAQKDSILKAVLKSY